MNAIAVSVLPTDKVLFGEGGREVVYSPPGSRLDRHHLAAAVPAAH